MLVNFRNGMNSKKPANGYWGLCFTAEQANVTISMQKTGSALNISLMTSTDAVNWTAFSAGSDFITLSKAGSKVWFKAGTINEKISSSVSAYWQFVITGGKVAASGSIMSILDGENGNSLSLPANSFNSLFYNCTNLIQPPDLPCTTMTGSNPYQGMFKNSGIRRIATTPSNVEVIATLANELYSGCQNLIEADMSRTLFHSSRWSTSYLGSYLFYGCTNLKKIKPALLRVAQNMFNGCTSLELVDFRHATNVVTLGNVNAFSNTNSTYNVVVPDSLYENWIATNNWKTAGIVEHIVKESEYAVI